MTPSDRRRSPPPAPGPARSRRHVVLIGLSGSGKSTVGRLLGARLARPFVDTDDVVVALAGRPIPEIFAAEGEPAFRELERRAVCGVLDGPPAVIATGGGAPVDVANRERLWAGNLVVWLDAPVDVLVRRVGAAGAGRPLLSGGAAERLSHLAAARRPVYAQAHLRLATAGRTPAAVAAAIISALEDSSHDD
jgi:shikimate kinase